MRPILGSMTTSVGRYPVVVILLTALVTVALASRISQGELVNDTSAFSPVTEEVLATEKLAERFGDSSTATIQVVVDGGEVVSAAGVQTAVVVEEVAARELGTALVEELPTVSFVTPTLSLAEAQGLDATTLDDGEVGRLQQQALAGPPAGVLPDPGTLPSVALDVAGLTSSLVAGGDPTTGDAGLLLVQLDRSAFADDAELIAAQTAFADSLRVAETPLPAAPFSLELISAPDDDFQAEVGQLFALAALVILGVLAFVLRARRGPHLGRGGAVRRSLADMLASIGTVMIAVVWVQGLAVVLGPSYLGLIGPASPPTQIVPVLLLALGVDYTIHLQGRYREELAAGDAFPAGAVARLGPTVGVALLLSVVTTAVGFLTNLASPIPAIRDLGVLSAAGIASAFLLSITFLPAVRGLLDRGPAARGELVVEEVAPSDRSLFARIALVGLRPALRAPAAMLAAAFVLAAAGAVGLTQLETEFDFTAFVPEDSPYSESYDKLAEQFGGGLAEVTEVLVTGEVLDVGVHNSYDGVRGALAGRPGVVALAAGPDVTTPVTVFAALRPTGSEQVAALDDARAAGLLPDGTLDADADVAVVYASLAGSFPEAAGVVDVGADAAVRLAVRTQSSDVGVDVVADVVDDAVAPVVDAGAEVVVTSQAIITDDVTASLRDSQVQGLILTVLVVALLLGLVYGVRSRQPGLGVLIVLPVVAVVLWTFGLMAATAIPFDPVTAVVSALVVGLGVDFSIHLGERFVEDLDEECGDVASALRSALRHTGAALAGSGATTVLGFSVLTTSSILPFQRLGIVTVYAVGLSLLATLFVLPSILVLYGRRQARHARASSADGHAEDELKDPVRMG